MWKLRGEPDRHASLARALGVARIRETGTEKWRWVAAVVSLLAFLTWGWFEARAWHRPQVEPKLSAQVRNVAFVLMIGAAVVAFTERRR